MAVATSSEVDRGESSNVSLSWDALNSDEHVSVLKTDSHSFSPKNTTIDALSMKPCVLPPREELDPVITFVNSAFLQTDKKSLQGYRAILDCLRKGSDPTMVRNVLLALRLSGSALSSLAAASKRHAHLLHLIFRLNPFQAPNKNNDNNNTDLYKNFSLADAHLHLLVALVSSNSVLLTPAMNSLWKLVQTEAIEQSLRLHAALRAMVHLVPKAKAQLVPLFASNFPFKTRQKPELEWYAKQCLFCIQYAPTIHGPVMELLVDKCLEIDVDIKIEEGGEVSIHQEEDDDDNLFELEMETPAKNEENVELKVDEMADKLDALMLVLFEHMQKAVQTNATTPSLLFKMVLPAFESAVLTTHRSKFVQFLVLYICGLEQTSETTMETTLARTFCSHLITIVFDPYRATATRQSAACYLASFVSRATYVNGGTVCESVCALLNWAEAYIQTVGNHTHAVDARDQCDMHSLFYTVCQAAFYAMCFRGIDVIQYYRQSNERQDEQEDEDASYISHQLVDISPSRWANICGHALQPLRYCLESVRGEFLDIARAFHLLDDKLLDALVSLEEKSAHRKKKPSLIKTATTLAMKRKAQGVGGLGRGSNPLDSFFPFDPYLLRQSHPFISPFYKDWEGSLCDEFDGLDIVSDEEDDEEHSIDGEHDEVPNSLDTHEQDYHETESPADPFGMSVSPSKSHIISSANLKTPATVGVGSRDTSLKKQEQKDAWARTLKRARAPSLGSGSW